MTETNESPAKMLAERKSRERKPRNKKPFENAKFLCGCRAERERLRLTMRDVCAAVGMSMAGMSAIERGNDVQMTSAIKLATFYGKRVDTLWKPRPA